MNSFLLSIGIAIAAALIAALVAPFFIDWGGYRSFFESRASELFGAPVKIEGDLSARLLPRPRIEASNVTIGDGSFHAEGLQIRLGLTPLMSGNLQVEHVRVTGAEVRVAADGAGRISGLERPGPQESTDDFTLDSIEIADGRLIVTGKGGEKIFDGVNLKASATNLDGPYKAEGSLRHDGETYDVSFATGRWSDDGDLRTKLSVTPRAQPVTFDMDGMARIDEGTPAFSGRVRLERIADANAPGSRWLFRGDTDANPANVRFTAMTLGFGPAERQFTLEGAGSLALGDHPRFDAVLGARQADLDRALGDHRRPRHRVEHLAVGPGRLDQLLDDRRVHLVQRLGGLVHVVEGRRVDHRRGGRVAPRADEPVRRGLQRCGRAGRHEVGVAGPQPDDHDRRGHGSSISTGICDGSNPSSPRPPSVVVVDGGTGPVGGVTPPSAGSHVP